ncbi:hypothetical protein EI546_02440 [Aequorivita sp. H23M31]|uniref:Uncharacterized protein n=1 Tax=Aequorivita ciconiae TaxID=2494375 RepID=A0A410G064_9FLAO|nr:hypothetical protein [Aequorivita sp. H23M31]QAA80654.1 hypothetical protein EI546_02440 [Aequorivita sp. H23M31]
MLKTYKLRSLKRQTDKSLAERDVSQRNAPLTYLGFLVDEALYEDFEMLADFGVELGLQRKNIKIFTFIETRKKIPSVRQNQITNKEFGWNGEIKNESAIEFLNNSFDVLIGYYTGKHDFLDTLVAQSKAKFKIGCNSANEQFFDLLLNVDLNKPKDFREEVTKYLKILKKI